MQKLFMGIDVQVQRPCAYVALNEAGTLVKSGWFASANEGIQCLEPLAEAYQLHFGIDAPRMPLSNPRKW